MIELDHFSVHVTNLAESRRDLISFGLKPEQRPQTLSVPGAWFILGNFQIHLGSRKIDNPLPNSLMTHPNHICFRVKEFQEVERFLNENDIDFIEAGSFGNQFWIHFWDGLLVEIQVKADLGNTVQSDWTDNLTIEIPVTLKDAHKRTKLLGLLAKLGAPVNDKSAVLSNINLVLTKAKMPQLPKLVL
jgi:hypothetical protein